MRAPALGPDGKGWGPRTSAPPIWCVYGHVADLATVIYVGQTKLTMLKRQNLHFSHARHARHPNKHFAAILTLGEEQFRMVPLIEGIMSKAKALRIEARAIAFAAEHFRYALLNDRKVPHEEPDEEEEDEIEMAQGELAL